MQRLSQGASKGSGMRECACSEGSLPSLEIESRHSSCFQQSVMYEVQYGWICFTLLVKNGNYFHLRAQIKILSCLFLTSLKTKTIIRKQNFFITIYVYLLLSLSISISLNCFLAVVDKKGSWDSTVSMILHFLVFKRSKA